MLFNESSDWDTLKRKKKEFYERMKNDLEFRLEQVDKKLFTLNSFETKTRYFRYKTTVIDTMLNKEYEIGLLGELKEYKGGKSYV